MDKDDKQIELIIGSKMCCPRCEKWENVLAYRPLRQVDKFAAATNQILKCPNCGWLFSPASISIEELHRGFEAILEEYGEHGGGGQGAEPGAVSARHLHALEGESA